MKDKGMKNAVSETTRRYPSIDVLRAFAAVGIVMMHMMSKSNNQYEITGYVAKTVIPWFTQLVYLFMMISAFGLCCGYHSRMTGGQIDLTAFYRKRVMRVLPYFSFLVILDLLSDFTFERLLEGIADITLVFGFLPEANKFTVMGIGWYIGITFVFYALFPLFSVLTRTKAAAWRTMAVAIFYNLACSYYFLGSGRYPNGFYARQNILFSAMFFVAGGIIYLYREDLRRKLEDRWLLAAILTAVVTVLYFALPFINHNRYVRHPYLALIYACWLICAVIHDFELKSLLGRLVRLLASYSMEIYLTHMMVFRILQKLRLNYVFGRGYASYFFTVLCALAGSLAVAAVFRLIYGRIMKMFAALPA